MNNIRILIVIAAVQLFSTSPVFSQAFGDYGRAVGGLPQGVGPRAPESTSHGGVRRGEIGTLGGKAVPVRLIVSTKEAGLYPKQDNESETVAQLAQGETLVPMMQTSGGADWYLVKTAKGVVGWVQSGDVKEEKTKK